MDVLNLISFWLIRIFLPIAAIFALVYLTFLFNNASHSIKKVNDVFDIVFNLKDNILNLFDFIKKFKNKE